MWLLSNSQHNDKQGLTPGNQLSISQSENNILIKEYYQGEKYTSTKKWQGKLLYVNKLSTQ